MRLRIDGMLKQVAKMPVKLNQRITARLKVMAQLDIAEKRVPQDGRIKLNLSKTKQIDFRVSTLPTLFGEKVVLRILDGSAAKLGIDKLGYEDDQQKLFLDAVQKPYGMVLVTGPTGSGKTVSLYTALNILNDEQRNISTVEDPVEIRVPGINQVQMNVKRGMTFAAALRSFLRQDPDVIMVGEIRDLETAEIAIKAAQTGHMVLSTLHTNDAPQTIARLMNMGIAPYNITSSVTLVIAQRLARRLHDCKREIQLPDHALLAEGFTADEVARRHQDLRGGRLRRLHRRLQGPHRHLPGHADERGDPDHHPGGRQRHADRRSRQESRRPRPAPVRLAQGQERHDQPRRNQPRHQGLDAMAVSRTAAKTAATVVRRAEAARSCSSGKAPTSAASR